MKYDEKRLEELVGKFTPSERAEFFALLASEKKEPNFKDAAFKAQTAFLEDTSRLKVVLCTRRSGKSYGAGLMLMKAAYENEGVSCLYVALTRASAKRIMWKDVLKTIDRKEEMRCRFNETELSVTLPNGSVIYLLGMDADESEKEKALGQKFQAVVVDEAASYSIDLNELVYGILKPATADYGGTIALIGTPGNLKRGLYYELTRGQDPGEAGRWGVKGWSGHRWSAFDNPHMAEKWKSEIEDLKLANPLIEQTTQYQQHYLGRWVTDDSRLVYRFEFGRNTFEKLPVMQGAGRWHYVLGIDLGFNDPTAWVVCAYHDFDKVMYVLGAHKKEHCDLTDVAEQTKKLMSKFEFDRIVVDNANKQAVEEMKRRHGLPLTPADKTGKADFIELMNADFVQGRIKVHSQAAVSLIEEYGELVWDERSGKREEHPGAPNHCCFVDGTMVLTRRGEVAIESVTSSDEVLTRDGWRRVEWCAETGSKEVLRVSFSDGRELVGTPEHPIWTENRGWARLDSLTATDVFVTSVAPCEKTIELKPLNGAGLFGVDGLTPGARATEDITSKRTDGCIEQYGSTLTDRFRRSITFIIGMVITATTTLKIWSAYLHASICGSTVLQPARTRLRVGWQGLKKRVWLRRDGTLLQRGASGIGAMPLRYLLRDLTLNAFAKFAKRNLSQSTKRGEFAVGNVTPAGIERVWALRVEGTPEYFANGVLVHNCDSALYSWRACYQYLSEVQLPARARSGEEEARWMEEYEEKEMNRLLEEKRARDMEMDDWEVMNLG